MGVWLTEAGYIDWATLSAGVGPLGHPPSHTYCSPIASLLGVGLGTKSMLGVGLGLHPEFCGINLTAGWCFFFLSFFRL